MGIYAITADFMSNWSYMLNADVPSNPEDIPNNCGLCNLVI